MLETGRVAAYVLDDVQLAAAIARSKDPSAYMISEETLSKAEPYGIMLRKDDAPFKAVADRATADPASEMNACAGHGAEPTCFLSLSRSDCFSSSVSAPTPMIRTGPLGL